VSEHMKCKCGNAIATPDHPNGVYSLYDCTTVVQIICPVCGRRGPEIKCCGFIHHGLQERDTAAAWAAWDADHEAVAKAREALELTLPLAKGYAAQHRVGRSQEYVQFAERALALLGEEDHDSS